MTNCAPGIEVQDHAWTIKHKWSKLKEVLSETPQDGMQ